jgi:SAM-dependent methyltransferase
VSRPGGAAIARAATRAGYHAVADRYAQEIGDELAGKPLDRALLGAFAELVGSGPVLDAGAGPGHIARALRALGCAVLALDLSPAMCRSSSDRGIPAMAGDLCALPLRDGSLAGLISLYAVIHLDSAGRAAAYREFARVLRPGGLALLSFHVADADTPAGSSRTMASWWGEDVDLTFHFLDPDTELAALTAAGFELQARLDREPYPGVEHRSRRCSLLLRRV